MVKNVRNKAKAVHNSENGKEIEETERREEKRNRKVA